MQLDALGPAVDILNQEIGPDVTKECAMQSLGKAVKVGLINLLRRASYISL